MRHLTLATVGLLTACNVGGSHLRSAPIAAAENQRNASAVADATPPSVEATISRDERKRHTKAHGFANINVLGKPGYYNLLLFSTDHCDPCKHLWEQADEWLRQYQNLAVTEIDVTHVFEEGTPARAPELALLRDFGLGRVPSAVLVSPLGYVVVAKDGADAITDMVHRAMRERPYREVISFGSTSSAKCARVTTVDAIVNVMSELGLRNSVRTERIDGLGPVFLQGQSVTGDKVTVSLVPSDAPFASGSIEDLARGGAVARIDELIVAVVVEMDADRTRARGVLNGIQAALRRTAQKR